jgi:hypothetical protein
LFDKGFWKLGDSASFARKKGADPLRSRFGFSGAPLPRASDPFFGQSRLSHTLEETLYKRPHDALRLPEIHNTRLNDNCLDDILGRRLKWLRRGFNLLEQDIQLTISTMTTCRQQKVGKVARVALNRCMFGRPQSSQIALEIVLVMPNGNPKFVIDSSEKHDQTT